MYGAENFYLVRIFIGYAAGLLLNFCCHARFEILFSWQHLSEGWQYVPGLFWHNTL